jgi:hypothetical protein
MSQSEAALAFVQGIPAKAGERDRGIHTGFNVSFFRWLTEDSVLGRLAFSAGAERRIALDETARLAIRAIIKRL